MNRSAKIVATIGPSCSDEGMIRKLIQAGMNVARLNFSHGSHEDHANTYRRIRQVSSELKSPVTILIDLQGPKIRTGKIENNQVEICAGDLLTLTIHPVLGSSREVSITFPQLIESVHPQSKILLDDGNLELEVLEVNQDNVLTRVVLGGILKSNKGVNLPGAHLDIPGFTAKDEQDLKFGLELGVDAVAVSFVRTANDIHTVRESIQRFAPERESIPIIAKLERPEALSNLEAILQAADGVMVARGDLGVEMAPETVPIAQKKIISNANRMGRIVITATQMLDSMINNPRPTRAEASDVANAIFDGSDAVMLSGETASGKYPLQSLEMMGAIICEAEQHILEWGQWEDDLSPGYEEDDTFFITRAAREMAHDRNVAAITIFTKSGRTALMMSKARPSVPIFAFTPDPQTYMRMNLLWGVNPLLVPLSQTIEEVIEVVDQTLLSQSLIQPGQQVVLVCGFPIQAIRRTNLTLLHRVGE